MDFIAYRFDCWPLKLNDNALFGNTEEEKIDGKANFEQRTNIIDGFFGDGDRNYRLGDGTTPVFKTGNDLVLRSYANKRSASDQELAAKAEWQRATILNDNTSTPRLPQEEETQRLIDKHYNGPQEGNTLQEDELPKLSKSAADNTYAARIIYHHDGVTVLRAQRQRKLKGENKDFQEVEYADNYVSSMAILVIRDDWQYLFVESTRHAFTHSTLAHIIESTLNRLLMTQYHVMLQVRPVRRLDDFWKAIDDKQRIGVGVKSLHFKFDYPNMPWPDELLGGRFKKMGLDLNAEADVTLKGHHGQPLKISTHPDERDKDIKSMAGYSCDKGNRMRMTFTDNSSLSFGYRSAENVSVTLPDALLDMQHNQSAHLFPKPVSEDIILKAKEVRGMNR